jgi:aarF domain-containing kinase
MSFFVHIITLFPGMQWISLPEEVNVFGKMMRQQLDLRIEADNLLIFENNFAPRNVPVSFPRPLKMFSTADLLVEEYENALPMEYFLQNGGGPFDVQLATVGLDAFLVCELSLVAFMYLLCYRTCSCWITLCTPISTRATSWSNF